MTGVLSKGGEMTDHICKVIQGRRRVVSHDLDVIRGGTSRGAVTFYGWGVKLCQFLIGELVACVARGLPHSIYHELNPDEQISIVNWKSI